MSTRSLPLALTAATFPDGSANNLGPAFKMNKGTEADPKKFFPSIDFDGAGGKELIWYTFRMPADYVQSPVLKLQWVLNATANAVKWQATLGAITPDDADTAFEHASAAASATTTNVNTTEANRVTGTSITLANTDSLAAGDWVVLCIFRDSADAADTSTVDSKLIAVTLEYADA